MSTCVKCGQQLHCAMADGDTGQPCWCTGLPPIPVSVLTAAGGDGSACFCPDCLRRIARDAGLVSAQHPSAD